MRPKANRLLALLLAPLFALGGANPAALDISKVGAFKLRTLDPAVLKITIPKPGEEKKAEGPDPAARLDLVDVVDDPSKLAVLEEAVGWDIHRIIQDKNAPNHFYYIPSKMLLTLQKGRYGLHVQYNASEGAEDASVLLTAEISAPYRTGDTLLLKALLKKVMGLGTGVKLHIHALQPTDLEANVESILSGLALPKERVGVRLPGTFRDTMILSLRLTPDETEEALALIASAGLTGTVVARLEEGSVSIPFMIRYTEFSGEPIPELETWRAGGKVERVTNATPFPMRLESVNAYIDTPKGPEAIFKPLKKSSPLEPGESRRFQLPAVKSLFGPKTLVVWMGVDLKTSCEPCIERVDEEIRSGIALNPLETLHFEALPSVFEKFGIYKIRVKVKTPYFTQKADKIATKEVVLSPEKAQDESLRLYMPQSPKRPDPLLFKYRLLVVFTDGTTAKSEWIKHRDTALYLGEAQIGPLVKKEKKKEE